MIQRLAHMAGTKNSSRVVLLAIQDHVVEFRVGTCFSRKTNSRVLQDADGRSADQISAHEDGVKDASPSIRVSVFVRRPINRLQHPTSGLGFRLSRVRQGLQVALQAFSLGPQEVLNE